MSYSRDQILLVLIAIMLLSTITEVIISSKKNMGVYNFRDFISNIIMGIGQQIVNVVVMPLLMIIFNYVQNKYGILTINETMPLNWIVLIILCDFTYYWAHRKSHEINYLIAGHIGHHQVEDYNHGSAFRQGWVAHLLVFPFYLPLALIGFPLKMFMLAQLGIMFVQFFSHNGVIKKKLGVLEYLIVTPRSHRVHHGIEDKYMNHNYGGIFIFWDKLFGTYAELEEEITFGIRGKIDHYDPIASNTNYFKRIIFVFRHRKGFFNKIAIWFQGPKILSEALEKYNYNEKSIAQNIELTKERKVKVLKILSATLIMMILTMAIGKSLSIIPKLMIASIGIFLIALTGRALRGQRLVPTFEGFETFYKSLVQNKQQESQI